MQGNREHYPQLDGLRGVAIAIVIVGHAARFSLGQAGVWTTLASAGVSIFFALSGFLITNILLAEVETTGSFSFKNFYARRALRLLPALFLFLAVMTVLKCLGSFRQDSWTALAASALYLRNIVGSGDGTGHLWSLSLEEQFYLTWPLLLLLAFRRRQAVTIAILLGLAAVRAGVLHFRLVSEAGGAVYTRPWFRYDSILYGCLIAILLRGRSVPRRWSSITALLHPVLTIPLLILATAIPLTSPLDPFSLTLQALLAAAVTFSVIVCPLESALYRILASVPFRFLGRISYSLYLWQQPFVVLRTPSWGGLRTFPVSIAVAVTLAVLSHYVVERPFLALKARFS
ncbi:MAG TPA: acyltransferase [Polyangia bacterium]|nr:acyltransferase [Polyangia bacterium]